MQFIMATALERNVDSALKEDGTIFPWGVPDFGGSMTDGTTADGKQYAGVPSGLQNVKTIFGDTQYFADSTAAQLLPCPHNTLWSWISGLHSLSSGKQAAGGSARDPLGYRQLHGVLAARKVLV